MALRRHTHRLRHARPPRRCKFTDEIRQASIQNPTSTPPAISTHARRHTHPTIKAATTSHRITSPSEGQAQKTSYF
ncbi:hypothetical protein SeMB42_g01737 [Synchytrium endobioticum]|uniref:Uncharacterized protein n=1 Tax=Synchytrium endobioticum TaxID=286115 RepID=A0A507DL23_9FUNG|nr:hypothetical protein SeMB42_g01737 [Synchytrium endobioticum]